MQAGPIEHTYSCRFVGGPLDGAVIECHDLHDEAIPHADSNAIYARVGREKKRFVGFATNLSEGIAMCDELRERIDEELCGGM
jgi:hypothetical protein